MRPMRPMRRMRLLSGCIGYRISILGGCVLALAAAMGGAGTVAARSRAGGSTPTYAPTFHRLATHAAVYAAGNDRLIGSLGASSSTYPAAGTLVNVVTRAQRRIVAPTGCGIHGLSSAVVTFDCSQGPDAIVVEHLPSGEITPLADGGSVEVGTDWMRVATVANPPAEHSWDAISFVNLTTGRGVPGFETIGSSSYADLDSPTLFAKACRPVTITATYDGNARRFVPGELVFVDRLAIHTSDPQSGSVGAQLCGSKTIHRYGANGFAANRRIVIWNHGSVLEGLDGRDGKLFRIDYPKRVAALSVRSVAINERAIYLQTAGNQQIWVATIPAALR